MTLSCVVCTIAGAPDAGERGNIYSVGLPYAARGWALRNLTLPWLSRMGFKELIVTGQWEQGPGYHYIKVPEVYRNIGDLLLQRQAGYDLSTGDWVLYLNDDTIWDPSNPLPADLECQVLSPSRWSRAATPYGSPLNDGSMASSPYNEEDYVHFHATLVRREVTQRIPWVTLPPEPGVDVLFSMRLNYEGIPWRHAPEYKVWDIELGARI